MKLGMGLGLIRKAAAAAATPDANTLFLARFAVSPPVNEVAGGATGTLSGDANCDTANKELVLDGTGDWASWTSNTAFNVSANWTIECHTNCASADVGGVLGRGHAVNGDNYVFYNPGNGGVAVYSTMSGGNPLLSAGSVLDGSWHHLALCRDGGTWRFYKDGVQVASVVNAAAPADVTDTFYVGSGGFDTANRAIAGRVARVKISNVCRYPSGTTFTPPVRTAV